MATEITLEKCKAHLSEKEFNDMDKNLTNDELEDALKLSNNGKAPGMDGIPYEFYKILDILFRQNKGSDHEMFNVLAFFSKVYEDVEKYGIADNSRFKIGWLCSAFKIPPIDSRAGGFERVRNTAELSSLG
jgi:hypothetical protein